MIRRRFERQRDRGAGPKSRWRAHQGPLARSAGPWQRTAHRTTRRLKGAAVPAARGRSAAEAGERQRDPTVPLEGVEKVLTSKSPGEGVVVGLGVRG